MMEGNGLSGDLGLLVLAAVLVWWCCREVARGMRGQVYRDTEWARRKAREDRRRAAGVDR